MIDYQQGQKINIGSARMNYMGIDHHKQYSHMTVMDQKG